MLKVTTVKNVWFATLGFLIMDSNFKIIYAKVVLIWQFCVYMSDITIITAKNVDYRCVIHNISESEAISLLKNSVLQDCGYI